MEPKRGGDRPDGSDRRAGRSQRHWACVAAVAAAAAILAAPSLRGGFLTGDDIQLVRDHVLINHPSLRHAVQLFSPAANRDLYQPVALLSFALNFAVVNALGLTAEATGPRAGAWLFHLTNGFLHIANSILVWWLVARLSRSRTVATLAAILFAIHPLNVETVAWLNGRMMLTSTLFALSALIAFDAFCLHRKWSTAVFCVIFVALTMMSKVRVGLPILLLIPLLCRRIRPSATVWIVWALIGAVTAVFFIVNVRLSRGMLAGGEEVLKGSGIVRAVVALGWYLEHYVVPSGLAPWHPPPNPALWSSPGLVPAAVILALAAAVTIVSLRWTRTGLLGMLWFGATIAASLPLLPSRNLLVAERYFYLPGIGLHWITASLLVWALGHMRDRFGRRVSATLAVATAVSGGAALLWTSWHATVYYRSAIDKCQRVAVLYPETEGVWEALAKSYYYAANQDPARAEQLYHSALEAVRTELRKHPVTMASVAGQLEGTILVRLGRIEDGIRAIVSAIQADPHDGTAHYRLAGVYEELGRMDEAVEQYEKAVERSPQFNPALTALARLYIASERYEAARRAFDRALQNNAYEVPALLGLAQIDITQGRYADAARRLETLLGWMPENAVAWTNLGVCRFAQGRRGEAIAAYRRAVRLDRCATPAVPNLTALLREKGDDVAAEDVLQAAVATCPTYRPVLITYHDLLSAQGRHADAARLWVTALSHEREAADLTAWYGWTSALTGRWDQARESAARAIDSDTEPPVLTWAIQTLVSLHDGHPDEAIGYAERVATAVDPEPSDVVSRLLRGVESFAAARPDDPFPIYVASMLLIAKGDVDAARRGIDVFNTLCDDESWRARASALLDNAGGPGDRAPNNASLRTD